MRWVQIGLIVYALAVAVLAWGFYGRADWAMRVWPMPYTATIGFQFVGAIIGAGAASILWAAVRREFGALVGIGLDAAVITGPIGVWALMSGNPALRNFGIVALVIAAGGVGTAIFYRKYPIRDTHPTPMLVRISFAVFIVVLGIAGGMMVFGSERVLPWQPPRESVFIYGCAFLGACAYFLYGLIKPVWGNAVGQLLAFLVYDLMLLWPFVRFFDEVKPEMLLNHIVYFSVVSYSAVLAIVYCFIVPTTRLIDRRG